MPPPITDIGIATLADLPSILDLESTQYGAPNNTTAFWRWRYFDNPAADVKVYVARNNVGQIVAMQAVSGYPMWVSGDILKAHLFTAAITHRDYRRQGLFRGLVKRIVNDLRRSGDLFIYTFPNNLSVEGFRRFSGWEQREILGLYVRLLVSSAWLPGEQNEIDQAEPVTGLSTVQLGNLTIREATCFDEDTTALVSATFVEPSVHILRSCAYLKWRYFDNPFARYNVYQAYRHGELVGYLVTRSMRLYGLRSGMIVDLVALDKQIARTLITRAVSAARRNKLQVMATWVGHFNPYRKAFLSELFIPFPSRLLPKRFYLYTLTESNAGRSLSNAVQKLPWYVTWGDTDVV